MTLLDETAFPDGKCPKCGSKGTWNLAARRMECKSCNLAGFGYTVDKTQTKPTPAPPSQPVAIPVRAESADFAQETYKEFVDEKQYVVHTVKTRIRKLPESEAPNLAFDENWGIFHRARVKRMASNEKRWGRDDLLRRGFTVIGYERDPSTDKQVAIYARKDTEKSLIVGRVMVATQTPAKANAVTQATKEAEDVAEKAWAKPGPERPVYSDDEVNAIIAEIDEVLRLFATR